MSLCALRTIVKGFNVIEIECYKLFNPETGIFMILIIYLNIDLMNLITFVTFTSCHDLEDRFINITLYLFDL